MTRKVTLAAARIAAGLQDSISLGDLDAARDWGYAKDYVDAMWLMLQQDQPDDFVLATGKSHTIRDLLETAFSRVELDWRDYLKLDDRFKRPVDPNTLLGKSEKAKRKLGWIPTVSFDGLIELMMVHDVQRALREKVV